MGSRVITSRCHQGQLARLRPMPYGAQSVLPLVYCLCACIITKSHGIKGCVERPVLVAVTQQSPLRAESQQGGQGAAAFINYKQPRSTPIGHYILVISSMSIPTVAGLGPALHTPLEAKPGRARRSGRASR